MTLHSVLDESCVAESEAILAILERNIAAVEVEGDIYNKN